MESLDIVIYILVGLAGLAIVILLYYLIKFFIDKKEEKKIEKLLLLDDDDDLEETPSKKQISQVEQQLNPPENVEDKPAEKPAPKKDTVTKTQAQATEKRAPPKPVAKTLKKQPAVKSPKPAPIKLVKKPVQESVQKPKPLSKPRPKIIMDQPNKEQSKHPKHEYKRFFKPEPEKPIIDESKKVLLHTYSDQDQGPPKDPLGNLDSLAKKAPDHKDNQPVEKVMKKMDKKKDIFERLRNL